MKVSKKIERICLLGNRALAVEIFRLLREVGGYELLVVVNPTDTGKDSEAGLSLLKEVHGTDVPWVQATTVSHGEGLERLRDFAPDLAISCSYEKIISRVAIDCAAELFVNFHYALLPRHRGCLPILWSLVSQDPQLGVTLHKVASGIDNGPILAQWAFTPNPNATAGQVYEQCAQGAAAMFARFLLSLTRGHYPDPEPQDESRAVYHTMAWPFDRWIPWRRDARKVAAVLNALTFFPHPSGRTRYGEEEIGLLGPAEPLQAGAAGPGRVAVAGEDVIVACGNGSVRVPIVRLGEKRYGAAKVLRDGSFLESPKVEEYAPSSA